MHQRAANTWVNMSLQEMTSTMKMNATPQRDGLRGAQPGYRLTQTDFELYLVPFSVQLQKKQIH